MNDRNITYDSSYNLQLELREFMTKVYAWMAAALVLTGFTAFYVSTNESLIVNIFSSRFNLIALIICELVLVVLISRGINKISYAQATVAFIVYSVINGLTLSIIFLAYTESSIAGAFFVTAGTFAVTSIFGYITKKDLSNIGNLAYMTLFGIIIATIANMFIASSAIDWAISYIAVLVFVVLTAYDTQKIKHMLFAPGAESGVQSKYAIIGALTLYLDFVNLFLYILRIFGKEN